MNNFPQIKDYLLSAGFGLGNQQKDFGAVIDYCFYYSRKLPNGNWQYVSLVTFDNRFCEGVYELFKGEKNTRDKKQVAVSKMLYRDLDNLRERIESEK